MKRSDDLIRFLPRGAVGALEERDILLDVLERLEVVRIDSRFSLGANNGGMLRVVGAGRWQRDLPGRPRWRVERAAMARLAGRERTQERDDRHQPWRWRPYPRAGPALPWTLVNGRCTLGHGRRPAVTCKPFTGGSDPCLLRRLGVHLCIESRCACALAVPRLRAARAHHGGRPSGRRGQQGAERQPCGGRYAAATRTRMDDRQGRGADARSKAASGRRRRPGGSSRVRASGPACAARPADSGASSRSMNSRRYPVLAIRWSARRGEPVQGPTHPRSTASADPPHRRARRSAAAARPSGAACRAPTPTGPPSPVLRAAAPAAGRPAPAGC